MIVSLEIPCEHGARTNGQKLEDDRCPGQDLVPKQKNEMEVSTNANVDRYWWWNLQTFDHSTIHTKQNSMTFHFKIRVFFGYFLVTFYKLKLSISKEARHF